MIRLFSLIVTVLLLVAQTACAVTPNTNTNNGNTTTPPDTETTTPNTEKPDPKLVKLTYETVDYHGGATNVSILDFNANTFLRNGYYPPHIDKNNPSKTYTNDFTDDEENVFLNACNENGLFDLDESYTTSDKVYDGGEWTLTLEYEDGTVKTSKGINAGPYQIFNKCSTTFYDLCGTVVLGILPQYYLSPPNISYDFEYFPEENHCVSSNGLAVVQKANYKWNKSELTDSDVYALNEAKKHNSDFDARYDYKFYLYTSNYDHDEKFTKLVVKQYDYNEALTNETVIFEGGWIEQIEMNIEMNKIYVYEMTYENGDYVQYTFNTYCNEQ